METDTDTEYLRYAVWYIDANDRLQYWLPTTD